MDMFTRFELTILDVICQTTLSRKLSTLLGVKHLSLDALWWKPGWQTSTREEFQDELRKFFRENEERGWIIDGNFTSQSGGLPRAEATDVICTSA